MPTGVSISDAREQLFDAAERVLLRDGPSALTSRAVTNEAGFAKGVLHRHFSDFDGFLAELVEDRLGRIARQATDLIGSAGTGTIAGNLSAVLTTVFRSVAVQIVALVISRDDLRARLRRAGHAGVPILAEATAMIRNYLAAERGLGRIAADADIDTLAHMLIGTVHLLYAGHESGPPSPRAVRRVVTTVMVGVAKEGQLT
jgi:AcrR family transcriptional regulator